MAAILSTLLVIFCITFILGFNSEIAHSPAGLSGALLIASVATGIAAFSLIVFALPLHLTLKYKQIEKPSIYLLSGALIGALMIIVAKPFGEDAAPTIALQTALFSIYGAITAGLFLFFLRKLNV